MKLIQADRDTLLKPLQTVTGIVERRHTLPILSNVFIELKSENISFVATDLEIQITTSTKDGSAVGDAYSVTVGAKKLQDILRALPEQAQVTLEAGENRLQAKAGKSRFNLQTLPAEDFPRFPESKEPQARITLQQRELKHLLSMVQYAMAQQDIRYYLNGLLLLMEDNCLRVVATDGHPVSNKFSFTWQPDAGQPVSTGSTAAPVCPTAADSAGDSASAGSDSSSVAATSDDEFVSVLTWSGGALAAVAVAVGVTLFILRRPKLGAGSGSDSRSSGDI
jgi:hypothetical protein